MEALAAGLWEDFVRSKFFTEVIRHIPVLVLRTTLLFLLVLLVMRWTGKRTVTALAPFDLALVIMVGEVAAIPISDIEVDLLHGLLPVVLLGGFHVLLTRANLRSKSLEHLTEGKGTLLVRDGQVLRRNMERERVSMQDLQAALRLKSVTDLAQVQEAWMEHTGGVSVILKPGARPLTPEELAPAATDDLDALIEAHLARLRVELARYLRAEADQQRERAGPADPDLR